MIDQVNKLVGIIFAGIGIVVTIIVGFFWYFLPALGILFLYGFFLAVPIYYVTFTIFNFQILWIVCSVFLWIGVVVDPDKVKANWDKHFNNEEKDEDS